MSLQQTVEHLEYNRGNKHHAEILLHFHTVYKMSAIFVRHQSIKLTSMNLSHLKLIKNSREINQEGFLYHLYAINSSLTHLQDNPFMDGKLGDDMSQQQMSVVLGCWVHTILSQQTRPGKRHQPTQLISLFSGRKLKNILYIEIHEC